MCGWYKAEVKNHSEIVKANRLVTLWADIVRPKIGSYDRHEYNIAKWLYLNFLCATELGFPEDLATMETSVLYSPYSRIFQSEANKYV